MEYIKKYSIEQIISLLNKKTVRFTANCQFFPNFDIEGKVKKYDIGKNGELIIYVKHSNGKLISIGTNMNDLMFEVLDKA